MLNLSNKKDETYVVLPADGVESDGVDILIENEGDGDRELEYVEALCAKCEWQDLDGVRDDERAKCETVDESIRGTLSERSNTYSYAA